MPGVFDIDRVATQLADTPAGVAFARGLLAQRREPAALPPAMLAEALALAEHPKTVVLVAVHHGNFPSLEYLAEVLREKGRATVAIYLQHAAPASAFSAVVDCGGSLVALADMIARLPPRAIYLQAHGRWALLSRLVAATNPGLRVVQELWDWMDAFVEPARAQAFVDAGLFDATELSVIREAERWARTRTAAFVHKHGGTALDEVVADHCVRELRVFPSPPRAWMRPPVPRGAGPWRLVHTGQLKPTDSARAVFGDLQWRPVIETLTTQGIELTAYGGAGTPGDEYAAIAAANPRFAFHDRVEVRALIDALHGRHDFGALLYHFDDDLAVGRAHLQTALASKLFVYLAAGLPVLVSPELGYMAELVQQHGFGLVVPRAELPRLAARLDDCDHAALHDAVARAQTTFTAEHTAAAIDRLLAEVSR